MHAAPILKELYVVIVKKLIVTLNSAAHRKQQTC